MKIAEEVKDAGRIGIGGHIRPDGDCVGACMALYLYLRKVFPEKNGGTFFWNSRRKSSIVLKI